jgi:methionyl-tRNA formyltransferase
MLRYNFPEQNACSASLWLVCHQRKRTPDCVQLPIPGFMRSTLSSRKLRIVFAGTPEFAVSSLTPLLESRHEVVAVYTQPDRPAGRGRKLRASPVKELALAHQLPVEQPERLRDEESQTRLAGYQADLMVVVAYGLLLPQPILDTPSLGCINVHASLLPRWRGAAPIHRALLAGDSETGVTIMQMEAGLDSGPMLAIARTPIGERETTALLHDRLASLGGELLVATIDRLADGPVEAERQDESLVTYAGKLSKEEGLIDWSAAATEIDRQIRAFDPFPVAHTLLNGEPLRIWSATPVDGRADPGLVATGGGELLIGCGQGRLRIERLQPAGKRAMSARDFLNAHTLAGTRLGV